MIKFLSQFSSYRKKEPFRYFTTSGGRILEVSMMITRIVLVMCVRCQFYLFFFRPYFAEICSRDEKNKESKANALGVENIGGVFVVLLCGLAFAILVAILEFCWNSKKNAQSDRQSLCSEMAEELRFAVRCHGSRQRPALKRNCVKCSPGAHTYVPSSFGLPHHYGVISLS